MPATRESLLVLIGELERKIIEESARGADITLLNRQLLEARSAFAEKANMLNENTSLLKG